MEDLRRSWLVHPLTISTAVTLISGVLAAFFEQRLPDGHLLPLLLYAVAYVAGGWHSTWEGVRALVQLEVEVDLLMVLAAIGAAVLGYWQEGAVLLFLFSLSNALQEFAMDRTRRAVASLMDLHPEEAWVRRDGSLVRVPVQTLHVGDLVIVRPGDRVPVDGEVVSGHSWVDESPVTGESVPAAKGPGQNVFAGTLNQNGVLEVRVGREPGDTILARIVKLVAQARSEKAATQERIERIEQLYAKAVILLAGAAAVIPIAFGEPAGTAIYRALTLMVVASPCAVAIAAPAAFLSAISAAARAGVLLKGGRYLERLADVDIVAIDKTGTLTTGQPHVAAVIPTPGESVASVLALAASVEAYAEHPFAAAIVREAKRRGVTTVEAEHVRAIPGRGVEGCVAGRTVRVGRPDLFADGPAAHWLRTFGTRLQAHGQTVVWIGGESEPVGLIALRDRIRPEAVAAVQRLRQAGARRIVMLTGDSAEVAQAVARRLGIDEVHAELLPEDKVKHIERLTQEGTVAMVGDGINDAPALARAHVGVAMGAIGSDAALESADVVLVDDQLERLPFALALGRRTRRVVLQGLGLAIAVIAGLVVGVLTGHVGLSLGVVGHEGSTLVVVANGLRLLFYRQAYGPREREERLRAPLLGRLDAA